jgi:Domain of unknown function (DUF4962)
VKILLILDEQREVAVAMLRILPLLFLVSVALGQTPDRAPVSDEWGYRPLDGSMVSLNPPSLSWVHEPESASYVLEWSQSADFKDAATVKDLPWSVYTHSEPLAAGTYHWRYRIVGRNGDPSSWSRIRRFTVPAQAVVFPQPSMDELRRRIPSQHPRVFVKQEDLARLRSWAEGEGEQAFRKLLRRADELLITEPTAEPSIRASASDPATNQF